MAVNPLLQAIRSGVRANESIGAMFATLGTGEHTLGIIPSIYRSGKASLIATLESPNPEDSARAAFASMRRELDSELRSLISNAEAFGNDEAARQLSYYEIAAGSAITLSTQSQDALDALLSRFDAQSASAMGLIAAGLQPNDPMIIGDDDRAGILRTGDLLGAGAFWLAFLAWSSWGLLITRSAPGMGFQKQVVAALDNRTTDCCLRAHGQIQPLDGLFELTGEPRYASKMDWTPFHFYCRSAVVLYSSAFDDGLTERMRAAADLVLSERASGIWRDRDPADAFG